MAVISLSSAASTLLLMVFLIDASHALDPASSASSSVEYWQAVLPSFPLPAELLKRVSPLGSSAALLTHYTQMMQSPRQAGVQPGMSSLCMAGRLYCSSSQFVAFRKYSTPCRYLAQNRLRPVFTAKQHSKNMFFKEGDLVEGAFFFLGDQKDHTPSAFFLPRQLASKLHPANANLLQAVFGIPPSSLLAEESIYTSQSLCKANADNLLAGEEAFCAYSLEDLADELKARMVAGAGGFPLKLLPISASSADTVQARLLKLKLEVEAAQPYLSCHAETYPFAVHYCHHIPNTRLYSAIFQPTDASSVNEIVRAVAICHLDTSDWNPQHVAFANLQSTPGRTEACHWTHENSLIVVASKN